MAGRRRHPALAVWVFFVLAGWIIIIVGSIGSVATVEPEPSFVVGFGSPGESCYGDQPAIWINRETGEDDIWCHVSDDDRPLGFTDKEYDRLIDMSKRLAKDGNLSDEDKRKILGVAFDIEDAHGPYSYGTTPGIYVLVALSGIGFLIIAKRIRKRMNATTKVH